MTRSPAGTGRAFCLAHGPNPTGPNYVWKAAAPFSAACLNTLPMEKTEVQNQVHLDSAIHLLTGDLAQEADRAGLDNHFQRWIEDLKAASNPAFHQLVVDMQALKAHFGSGSLDVDIIAPLLARLGTNTAQAANFAEGNTAPRVAKLGEVLSAVAQQLKGGTATPDGTVPQDMSSHN